MPSPQNPPNASLYTAPHQFEPLLPQRALERLVEQTRAVFEKSLRLSGCLHIDTLNAIREVVRSMNSYYSNLIEGQGTHPANIDRALKADFSRTPEIAQRQRIAVAHIEAERELEGFTAENSLHEADVLASDFLIRAHRSLYGRLATKDRTSKDRIVVEPGGLRTTNVTVGRHVAPAHESIPRFLERMDEVYGKTRGVDSLLYTIGAAHHRGTWVHPFVDGNGRACRLQTHCALFRMTRGLWSANRGFARQRERYYEMLAAADAPRRGDLDGRGNLSESALREWCEFFITTCEDQASFMASMLDLAALKDRIAELMALRTASARHANYRRDATRPLQHVSVAGALSRGDFVRMMGIPERTAQRTLRQLLDDGLLASDGPKAPVRLALPLDALDVLFPGLYPEAAAPNFER